MNGNIDTKIYSDADVLEIVRTIRALQNITKTSGTITTRTQSHLLRALPEDVLVRVSLLLDTPPMAALYGKTEVTL